MAKGEERPREKRRLERQADMSLAEMLADLPRHCAVGVKRNAKGYQTHWIGYKLHLDVADVAARQPGGDPARHHDGGAGH